VRAAPVAAAVVVIGVLAVLARKAIVERERTAWAERATSAIARKYPAWEFSRPEPDVLEVAFRGSHAEIRLDSMRRNAEDDAAAFEEQVLRAAESAAHVIDRATRDSGTLLRFENVRQLLLPVLVSRGFAEAQKLVTLPFVGDVLEAFVFDGEHHQQYVSLATFAPWGVETNALHAAAIARLSSRVESETWPSPTRPTDPAGSGEFIVLDMSDGYASSRLLSPEARERLGKVLGYPFFAGIPNRDFLVAWSNGYTFAGDFTAKLREDFARRSYPVSPQVYRVDASGISLHTSK
jgi:hypothetical protein